VSKFKYLFINALCFKTIWQAHYFFTILDIKFKIIIIISTLLFLGWYFTNTETLSVKNNMEVMKNTDTAMEPYKYCTCKEKKGDKSVMCTHENCPNFWYHYVCLGIKRKPTSKKWKCEFYK